VPLAAIVGPPMVTVPVPVIGAGVYVLDAATEGPLIETAPVPVMAGGV
jgi:hypothetical protein